VKLAGAFRTVSRAEDFDGTDAVSEHELDLRREQTLYEALGVSCYQDDDGLWIIKAKLPAEAGGLLVKVIKELGDQLAAAENTAEQEKSEKVAADAFSEYKKDDSLNDKLLK
jgi:hypothetical protein